MKSLIEEFSLETHLHQPWIYYLGANLPEIARCLATDPVILLDEPLLQVSILY
jgi:ABC-type lipopolysaccharide export system ATPase subunit